MSHVKFREWNAQKKMFHYWGVGLLGAGTFTSKLNPLFPDQQFTGLTDKNGKEIYEGDIVVCNRYEDQSNYIVYVPDLISLSQERDLFGSNLNWREVIGNIHENPDLQEKYDALFS